MTEHPAHGIARMIEGAATELGGYLDPRDPFPWELTEEDHRAILPLLDRAISALSACLDGISQATAGDYAKQQLTEGKYRLVQASAGVRLAVLSYEPDEQDDVPGEEPETVTQPAHLSAADFPAVMTAGVLQAASSPPAQATGPAISSARRARARPPQGNARTS
ncbi:MAG: hypothetical protein ACRDRJ_01860 [Streptosporangiaceae bacterium]